MTDIRKIAEMIIAKCAIYEKSGANQKYLFKEVIEVLTNHALKIRKETIEECLKAITNAECLKECDGVRHVDNCPYVYPEEAIRKLGEA